jgi:Rne/Rng family ribonuclease
MEILITKSPLEVRLIETVNGKLKNLIISRDDEEIKLGNIYLGRVDSINKQLNAAFVDIGIGQAGFLSGSDAQIRSGHNEKKRTISELYKEGDKVIVQVKRDISKGKGLKLTTKVELRGRNLFATMGHSEIIPSRSIKNLDCQKKILNIIDQYKNPNFGFMIRTKAQFSEESCLVKEVKILVNIMNRLFNESEQSKKPRILYHELDPIRIYLRNIDDGNLKRIIVDDRLLFSKIKQYLEEVAPSIGERIEFTNNLNIHFDSYEINQKIQELFEPKLVLDSGVVLHFNETPALVAIDVDSHSLNHSGNSETFALDVNRNAAREIGRQIILRNLAGQIVIDFLPIKRKSSRKIITEIILKILKEDKRSILYGFTNLGLFELSRHRIGESLSNRFMTYQEPIRNVKLASSDLFDSINRELRPNPGKILVAHCSPNLYRHMNANGNLNWKIFLENIGPVVRLLEDKKLQGFNFEVV